MRFAFDHLVQFVEDPHEAMTIFKEKGLHAIAGGEHQNGQTYNTLSYFDLSYIEFIGVLDKKVFEQTEHSKRSLMHTVVEDGFTEGFSRFVMRTDDIEGAARYFREKGLMVDGPLPRSRKRPDGSVIEWHLLLIGNEDGDLELPYVIDWNESDEERREKLIESGAVTSDSSGAVFTELSFAVKNVDDIVGKWSDWLNLQVGEEIIDEELNAKCRTLKLPGGDLVFCSPLSDGIVSEVLQTRGEKPFQVKFTSGQEVESFELFGGFFKKVQLPLAIPKKPLQLFLK